jgi:hypothetical protein
MRRSVLRNALEATRTINSGFHGHVALRNVCDDQRQKYLVGAAAIVCSQFVRYRGHSIVLNSYGYLCVPPGYGYICQFLWNGKQRNRTTPIVATYETTQATAAITTSCLCRVSSLTRLSTYMQQQSVTNAVTNVSLR